MLSALLSCAAFIVTANALGQQSCVSFNWSSSAFTVVNNGVAAQVLTSSDDWSGVHLAVNDFVDDINKVTGITPQWSNVTSSSMQTSSPPIIVGTLGKSSLISAVVNNTKLDVSSISGQWEAFMAKVVSNPLPGVDSAYVIIGADKRGTIFALYDHSEQFGVSPWYWWADVPTTQNQCIFLSPSGCSHGSPTVKVRGIFLNDEQPALQNWAMEKFTNGTGSALLNSPFNHMFYQKLFELILRLKGNFLWPAIWGSAFGIDDTLNQPTADFYGVIMGTSHEEPMMRSIPNEWDLFGDGPWNYSTNSQNIYNFWVNGTERSKTFESIYTVGMRGDGDLPLSETTNIDLLEKVVADQRQILMNVFNRTDVTDIPQAWALYKEVQGYYEDGMRVPDDVTLLWTDDNWGNIRRLPIPSEMNRTGGAGVYYHVDYVGDPRDYKWITSSQITKTFEQMSLAVDREATRIWVLNVGDLKPYELHTEFFLTMGWNSSLFTPTNINGFVASWAQREFDLGPEDAASVAQMINNVTRFNNNRKPELLNGTLFSLTDYREAENVLAAWNSLNESAAAMFNSLPEETQPSFFQTVYHPIKASFTLNQMWILQGLNNLKVSQARMSANQLKDRVEELFDQDWDIENEYHTMLDGKWDHMMDQTHVGYFYWQQPMANTMPLVSKLQSRKQVLAGPMRISPEGTHGTWPGDNPNNCAQMFSCPPFTMTFDNFVPLQQRFIDVGSGTPSTFTFQASSNVSWLNITPTSGTIAPTDPDTRVEVTVPDWSQVSGTQIAQISFVATTPDQPSQNTTVFFMATNNIPTSGFKGFVEGDGGISMEAAHSQRNTTVNGVQWIELPGYGKTLSGVTPWPRTGNGGNNFTVGNGPRLEFDFHNFNTMSGNITVVTLVSPSLNANGEDRPLKFAVQVDSSTPQIKQPIPNAVPGQLPNGWDGNDGFVANAGVSVNSTFTGIQPGPHTLRIWMIEPAVILQKIFIDTGGVRPSYYGPPESILIS